MEQKKKFYDNVSVVPNEAGYSIFLDGKILKTPAAAVLSAPSLPLIEAVRLEWDSQRNEINFKSMPLFSLLATSIDRVAPRRTEVNKITLQFGGTDLLCYRAKEPIELTSRQGKMWQPLIDWAENLMEVEIHITDGILPINQPEETLKEMEGLLADFSDLEITAVSSVAASTGSLIIGLAIEKGAISEKSAADISLLEELYQIERWGEDEEMTARHRQIRQDIYDACKLLKLIQ